MNNAAHKIPTKTIQSGGVKFRVRIIRRGNHYGLNNCLTHDEDNALVEFWDGKQFVSRYYATTLLGEDEFGEGHSDTDGLSLQGDEPRWSIEGPQMARVRAWVRQVRSNS